MLFPLPLLSTHTEIFSCSMWFSSIHTHTHTHRESHTFNAFLAYFIALYALSIFASLLCVVNLKNHVVFCVGNAPAELVWVVWMSLWKLCSPRSLTHYVDAISAGSRRYLYISASAICVASSGSSSSNLHTSVCLCVCMCDTRLQAALPFAY